MSEPQISFAEPQWFVALAEARRELRAELELASLGYRVFVPKARVWHSHARRKKAVQRPLLGRYLFVEVDYPRQAFAPITTARAVTELITTNAVPAVVPRRFVEDLLLRQLKGEWDSVANTDIPIAARVRIVEGRFDEMLGTVTGRKGNQFTVSVDGEPATLKLTRASIRAA